MDQKQPKKYRTITLTDHPPIRIVQADWPCIAEATAHDGRVECQANHRWSLRVRQHADGRAIVYGIYDSCYPGQGARAGRVIEAGGDLVDAIHWVAERCDCERLAADCIADLPAQDLT